MLRFSNAKLWKMAFPQYNIPDDADPNDLAQMQQIQNKYQQPSANQTNAPASTDPNIPTTTSELTKEAIQVLSDINSILANPKFHSDSDLFINRTHSISIDVSSVQFEAPSEGTGSSGPWVLIDGKGTLNIQMFPDIEPKTLGAQLLPKELQYMKTQTNQTSGKSYVFECLTHLNRDTKNRTAVVASDFIKIFWEPGRDIELHVDTVKIIEMVDERDKHLIFYTGLH